MRQLDTDELLNKFNDYGRDILYSDFNHLNIKIEQLFNFLNQQEIASRILERISEDFKDLKVQMAVDIYGRNHSYISKIKNELITRETQGAFSYFALLDKFKIERKYSNHYLNLADEWYRAGANYNEWQSVFNTYFFEPFSEIIEWYLRESKIESTNDYFSYESQNAISEKLEEMGKVLSKLGYGQEIVFNEIHDVKKLTKKLNKKNWDEIIIGKFVDLSLSGIISIETGQMVIKLLTGHEIIIK